MFFILLDVSESSGDDEDEESESDEPVQARGKRSRNTVIADTSSEDYDDSDD